LPVKKSAKTNHECIVILDGNGNARIERLQGASYNLNEKVGQVPERYLHSKASGELTIENIE